MNICFQYARPASGQSEGEIYGLDVAVRNLLTAWFRYGTSEKFICRPVDMPSFDHFKELARQTGLDPETRCVGLDPRFPQHNLESMGCLFRPDPLIGDLTWRRQQMKGKGFATCGLVHTMSGERITRAVSDLCYAPTDETDALICPSESIKQAIHNLWDIAADYLGHRFGTKFRCPIQTPIIPLGIDTDSFQQKTTPEKRQQQRQNLQVDDHEIVVLFVGRLSFATKAHPLALWRAAEMAAHLTARKIRVVMYGYFKPKDMEKHFRDLAAEIAKEVSIEFITNDDVRFPDGLWAGADIFVSLADNVQESFGLTPIEAMACGLPVIAADWDGYRSGVRHGHDGFLIPTFLPPPAAGLDIARAYYNEENYGISLMGSAQSTFVDIYACAQALHKLIENDHQRHAFGAKGRAYAAATFDWKHIIRAYEELWQELAQKRQHTSPSPGIPMGWQAVHPAFPNPWKMFESFPTRHLSLHDRFTVLLGKDDIVNLMKHEMNFFLPELLVDKNSMLELIDAIRRAGVPSAQEILNAFPQEQHDRIWRCLGWMLKHGICSFAGGDISLENPHPSRI